MQCNEFIQTIKLYLLAAVFILLWLITSRPLHSSNYYLHMFSRRDDYLIFSSFSLIMSWFGKSKNPLRTAWWYLITFFKFKYLKYLKKFNICKCDLFRRRDTSLKKKTVSFAPIQLYILYIGCFLKKIVTRKKASTKRLSIKKQLRWAALVFRFLSTRCSKLSRNSCNDCKLLAALGANLQQRPCFPLFWRPRRFLASRWKSFHESVWNIKCSSARNL